MSSKCDIIFTDEFGAILDSSFDGIHIVDKNGVTIFYNKICEDIEGIKKEDILYKNISSFVDNGIFSNSVALEAIELKSTVKSVQKVNGRDILAKAVPLFLDSELSLVVVYSRDMTHLNRLKVELSMLEDINNSIKNELINLKNMEYIDKNIIAVSSKMKNLLDMCVKISNVDSTILITGESGSGKGVLSKFIHNNSSRSSHPFVKIDCSVIPDTLIESELFGYDKGAFTGAQKTGKLGLVELANNGTLFLDEIGELPLLLQSKLLTLIQDREFYRVGGNKRIPVDIRIITATNKDLQQMVKENKFREDLFYRLNVVPMHIPPLRERKDDILPLINMFLNKFNDKYSLGKSMSQNALDVLLNYSWPGNVRELENIIERLVVTSYDSVININDIPTSILNNFDFTKNVISEDAMSLSNIMDNYEKNILLQVKNRCNDTQEMANMLRIDRSTVRRKLNKFNIDIEFK